MRFWFHPLAEMELSEAAAYYEDEEPGLGYDFSIEVYWAIRRAMTYPKAWTALEGDIRRSMVRRFPYGVLYSEELDGILIVAVMNLHREPHYWKERI
ncbi:MAG: type II toxin-antitoxin system RelE/ParE family toxin [Gammaproteobacteria bacterium]|nr:type II toxin-antitoxin system RelE/ParE family toxin [Gammaproteobacteria bacterium]